MSENTPRIWEPVLAIALAACAIALTGCQEKADTSSAQFNETKSECMPSAVPNSYVVRWKDGSTSVERGWTKEDFKREIFEPNKDEIEMAEQDQRVQLAPMSLRPEAEVGTNAGETQDWGQNMISAADAWNAGVEGDGVVVAVVDSGVDITHPQLVDQVYINTGEIPGNHIDDDGNGYVDDVKGWDFDRGSNEIGDSAGHGTHVAGIILAEHMNGGVNGLAPKAKLLPLDFMNSEGSGNIGDAILAIHYAVDRGARVINASWGGAPCSSTLQKTIGDLRGLGVLFVAAAGNSGADLDQMPEYPAAFTVPGQITVGASTARDFTAVFSNYSFSLVHLFAPGAQIYSTYPGARIVALSGTSMAAPFVSGAAALLFSAHPNATVDQVRNALLKSVDHGGFAATSQGRLNVRRALETMK